MKSTGVGKGVTEEACFDVAHGWFPPSRAATNGILNPIQVGKQTGRGPLLIAV